MRNRHINLQKGFNVKESTRYLMSTLERVCESILGSDGAQIRHVQGGSRGFKLQFRCLSGFRDAVTVYLTKRTYNLYLE